MYLRSWLCDVQLCPEAESSEAVRLTVQSFRTSALAEGRESINKSAGRLAGLWDLAPSVCTVASSSVSEDFQEWHVMAQQEVEHGEQLFFCFLLPFRSHSCFNKGVQFWYQTPTPPSWVCSPTAALCLANCCYIICSQSNGIEKKWGGRCCCACTPCIWLAFLRGLFKLQNLRGHSSVKG